MAQNKPLPKLEADIENLLTAIESADDPTLQFAELKAAISEYKTRSRDLREDWYKQRNTISRQASTIAESEIDLLAGHRAPTPSESQPNHLQTVPDVIAIESAPNCLFVKLSHGFTNLLQIVDLDVKARTLFTTSGTRTLTDGDTRKLIFHLKLYSTK
ncbi:MAG: hypothetical protein K9J37_13590 [Saprospiraceae bacterium]|nr:hypothetical protein [Saprospiraceae bacterium]MCF8250942.1 hypothetical protein [Saprospiraceae bacterium]MCF8281919.1 hypothetical protein [Bacteroidales bacterium]MCF8311906.1 hypothetical protein [Saprospiraceae bacterium]MCF8441914.1 hypothetical protein [Saprospiraceae bacterium]